MSPRIRTLYIKILDGLAWVTGSVLDLSILGTEITETSKRLGSTHARSI